MARLVFAIALWVGLHLLGAWTGRAPAPLPADADPRLFSAGRAELVLERLLDGIGAHPAGSADARVVRERLVKELERIGLMPFVDERFARGPYGAAGRVHNVLVRLQGSRGGPATLLVAHYDSVAAGPGVSDDLAAVAAVVESTRAMMHDGRPARTLLLLLTDAEEDGLIGAEAFATSHAWMDEVGAVLNFEARGTSGPSRMFETGPHNRELVELFARAVPHPSASSVSYEIYRRMPNDTDYSVFKERGVPGLNFAFIGNLPAYHAPLDDLEHLSRRSLQHHGENMLAMLQALDADAGYDPLARGDAVFADFHGRYLVVLGTRTCQVLSLLSVLSILWGAHRAARAGAVRWGQVTWGLCAAPLSLVLPIALGVGFAVATRAVSGAQRPWWDSGSPTHLGLLGASALGWGLTALAFGRCGALAHAHGAWVWWGLLALLTSLFLPGASYLFLAPASAVALATLGVRQHGDVDARAGRIAVVALVVAVTFWAPVQGGLTAAFGYDLSAGVTAPLALLAMLAAPLLVSAGRAAQLWVSGLGFLLLVFGFATTLSLPHESSARPATLNLTFSQEVDTGRAAWGARLDGTDMPAALAQAGGFARVDGDEWSAPAPDLDLAPPTFEVASDTVTADGERVVRGVLRSPRGATRARLRVDGARPLMIVEGVRVLSGERLVGLDERGFRVELRFEPLAGAPPSQRPVRLWLQDVTAGLPPAAEALVAARPSSFVPRGRGDRTTVSTRITLN
jgi:hypothetical protein